MPKTTKKTVSTRKSKQVAPTSNPFILGLAIVLSSIIIGPSLWLFFNNPLYVFVVPAIVSLFVAFLYSGLVGSQMSTAFRNETTTIVAVLGVITAVLVTIKGPMIGLNGQADTTFPIFLIFFRSVWALTATLLTVYLPLGITTSNK